MPEVAAEQRIRRSGSVMVGLVVAGLALITDLLLVYQARQVPAAEVAAEEMVLHCNPEQVVPA